MQENTGALVSIIVCTYNRSAGLAKTLDSLLRLEYQPLEIIVVDNRSTDDTATVAQQYPVRYFREDRPGVAYARNTGLAACRGEFAGFIDDDETVVSGWVQGALRAFDLDAAVAAVTGPVYPVYEQEPPAWLEDTVHTVPGEEKYRQYRVLTSRENLGTGNSLFRRSALEGVLFNTGLGRSGKSLLAGEDTDFVCQLYDRGYRAAYSPEAAVYHFIPRERVTLCYFMRRFFYEGLTEYRRKGRSVVLRRLLKPLLDAMALVVAVLSGRPRKMVSRWLRLCQTAGILYGPLVDIGDFFTGRSGLK
ncbi:MAG TPA: glycosyltransferase [Patescibacteria group bacterium]|nr:glycosyltransferase [Patescibacteria group bacterium]